MDYKSLKKAYLTIAKIHEYADRFIIQELKKNNITGLVPSHGEILLWLYQNDKMTMKNIADKIHRSKSTVTVLVNKLEKIGFVQREILTTDNRYSYISLTQKGKDFKPIFDKITDATNEKLYKNVSDNEYRQLDRILDRMLENIKRR